ncbi:MAG: hypothetical protein J5959_07250 [Butyrivibrio sp.]|nr:hypothetical protein [Butyrivibrio sp.]
MCKKGISIALAILCLTNPLLVSAEEAKTTPAEYDCKITRNEDEVHKMGLSPDSIYVDGVKCDIDINFKTGNIIVTGESRASESTLILESDGDAKAILESSTGESESYSLDIQELSKDDVDVEVFDDNGNSIAEYDSYSDLVEKDYQGQEAITVGLVIGVTLLLTITTYYVIVRNGDTYCYAKHFTKAISKAKEAIQKQARAYYYPAAIVYENNENVVYICPKGINVNAAATIVASDGSIYSYTSKMAKKAITTAGYIPMSFR